METPYNENLLLSSGVGARRHSSARRQPPPPGERNQGEFGVQQGFGRWIVVDVGYFNKHTENAYDFNVLFNTPIVFPGRLGSLADRRLHRPGESRRARRLQRVRRDGAYQRHLLAAGRRRRALRRRATRRAALPDRSRSEVQRDDEPAVRLRTSAPAPGRRSAGGTIRASSPARLGTSTDLLTLTAASAGSGRRHAAAASRRRRRSPITNCKPGDPVGDAGWSCRRPAPAIRSPTPPRVAPRNLFDLGIGADNLFRADKVKLHVRFLRS